MKTTKWFISRVKLCCLNSTSRWRLGPNRTDCGIRHLLCKIMVWRIIWDPSAWLSTIIHRCLISQLSWMGKNTKLSVLPLLSAGLNFKMCRHYCPMILTWLSIRRKVCKLWKRKISESFMNKIWWTVNVWNAKLICSWSMHHKLHPST